MLPQLIRSQPLAVGDFTVLNPQIENGHCLNFTFNCQATESAHLAIQVIWNNLQRKIYLTNNSPSLNINNQTAVRVGRVALPLRQLFPLLRNGETIPVIKKSPSITMQKQNGDVSIIRQASEEVLFNLKINIERQRPRLFLRERHIEVLILPPQISFTILPSQVINRASSFAVIVFFALLAEIHRNYRTSIN